MKIILLFSALLWAQTFTALEARAVNPEENKGITDRDLLFMYSMIQFQNMASPTVNDFRKLFASVVTEAERQKLGEGYMESQLAKIEKLQEDIERLDYIRSSGDRSAKLLEVFIDVLGFLEELVKELKDAPTDEHNQLNAILQRNGIEQFAETFHRRFVRFTRNVSKKVGEYLNLFTEEQKLGQREVVQWKTAFDATNDPVQAIDLFVDLLLLLN